MNAAPRSIVYRERELSLEPLKRAPLLNRVQDQFCVTPSKPPSAHARHIF
jgi:hypothetical protein